MLHAVQSGALTALFTALLTVAAQGSDTQSAACRTDARVVASCYSVHGRLSNWNGNPTRRIWVVGTKRMLGLRDGAPLPQVLEDTLGTFDQEIYGDFEFCPFTPQRPGVMQVGCVAKVSKYQVKPRKQ